MKLAALKEPGLWELDGRTLGAEELGREVAGVLRAGAGAVLPTDSTYGLCFSLAVQGWLERLCAMKGRPEELPVSLFFASVDQMFGYTAVTSMLVSSPPFARARLSQRFSQTTSSDCCRSTEGKSRRCSGRA